MPCRAKALRGVINQPQAIFTREIANRGIIGGLAKQPNADNANNIDAGGFARGKRVRQFFWIKVEAGFIDFGKNRYCAHDRHHFSACGKGKRGNDNALAGLQL